MLREQDWNRIGDIVICSWPTSPERGRFAFMILLCFPRGSARLRFGAGKGESDDVPNFPALVVNRPGPLFCP